MRVPLLFCGAALFLCLGPALSAQDAVKVDPKHYTVVSENDQVRILKAHYGPHEKSVMHSHPATVAVFVTDSKVRFTFPDGKTADENGRPGDALYNPAVTHLPENTGDKPFEVIVVELKSKGASKAAAKAGKK
jgi:quercetin dioxygenase-like cupin family protein